MKKWILRSVLAVVILVVVAVVIVAVAIDSIAEAGLEKGAGYAMGVETQAQDVSLSLAGGRLTIGCLNVSNPEGFATQHLMRSGRFELQLVPLSVFGETIEVRNFELDGLDLNIEQKLTASNISKVINNLKRFETTGAKQAAGKKLKADRIHIRNVVAHFHLLSGLIRREPLTVKVPEIELTDVTSDEQTGVLVGELVARLVPAILAAVVDSGQGTVPAPFLVNLDAQIADLTEALGPEARKLAHQAESQLEKAVSELAGEDEKGEEKTKDPAR